MQTSLVNFALFSGTVRAKSTQGGFELDVRQPRKKTTRKGARMIRLMTQTTITTRTITRTMMKARRAAMTDSDHFDARHCSLSAPRCSVSPMPNFPNSLFPQHFSEVDLNSQSDIEMASAQGLSPHGSRTEENSKPSHLSSNIEANWAPRDNAQDRRKSKLSEYQRSRGPLLVVKGSIYVLLLPSSMYPWSERHYSNTKLRSSLPATNQGNSARCHKQTLRILKAWQCCNGATVGCAGALWGDRVLASGQEPQHSHNF